MSLLLRTAGVWVGVLPLLFGGCRTLEMTPEARRVEIAQDAGDVAFCKFRGEVFALAPFRSVEEPVNQLKVRAQGIGADTVLVAANRTEQRKDWQAKAFRCADRVTVQARADTPAGPSSR